jgi:hypothetical protein
MCSNDRFDMVRDTGNHKTNGCGNIKKCNATTEEHGDMIMTSQSPTGPVDRERCQGYLLERPFLNP